MEVSVKELLNKKIQERYSDGREQIELRELIAKNADSKGQAVITVTAAKEFKSTYGYNYLCHTSESDEVFFFSSASLKKTIKELLNVDEDFFENGEVLTVLMENREIMGKMSAMVVEVL
jgi:hypothetical protein